jgi:8-oxo-dGTP diphosphatase
VASKSKDREDKDKKTGTIWAAGAVAWRLREDGAPEILLVHRKRYDDWSLPKGKAEPGEKLPATAVREVCEEGGAAITLGRRLISVRYRVKGRPKRVSFWAARVTGVDERAVPNEEVDEAAWLSLDGARGRVSYQQDLAVLDDFATAPADTVPLILLRHAKALARADWKGDDARRSLAASGQADARVLAGLLTCFAPQAQVFTSPTVRCEDTVRPYAEVTSVRLRTATELAISRTPRTDSSAFLRTVLASGKPAICCAHRENLPTLVTEATAVLGAPAPPGIEDTLPTSGFYVLQYVPGGSLPPGMAGLPPPMPPGPGAGRLVAADRYELSET